MYPRKSDWTCDTWEIQDPGVTVTRSQFWRAVNELSWTYGGSENVRKLARKLGLED
jgi:hypothetical protein